MVSCAFLGFFYFTELEQLKLCVSQIRTRLTKQADLGLGSNQVLTQHWSLQKLSKNLIVTCTKPMST